MLIGGWKTEHFFFSTKTISLVHLVTGVWNSSGRGDISRGIV